MMKMLARLWPKRLAGQMIALLLLALILAQVLTVIIFADERRFALRAADRMQLLGRTASIVRLLENSPPAIHKQILQTASNHRQRYWLSAESAVEPGNTFDLDGVLEQRMADLVGEDPEREVLIQLDDEEHFWSGWWRGGEENGRRGGWQGRARHGKAFNILVSTHLQDGRWLNVENRLPPPRPAWALPALTSLIVMALTLSAVVIVMVRRITRPMAALATAAERAGRGEAIEPLPEIGPLDIRQTTRAFNRMYDRLQRFIEDRTRMLAAMSHDLRTPITSLRLRAEFIDDDEIRGKILETLEEMQRMSEATLAFAREEAAVEDTRVVDLAALIDSVVEDLADLGHDVAFEGAPRAPYACRPTGIKRVLRNLIENAIRYGERARVALDSRPESLRITVDDDGPGIPEGDIERMFQPFVRMEESRSKATGGIGLGLAISRSIIHRHGGEVSLENRPGGGLRATITLPSQPVPDDRRGGRASGDD